MAAVDFLELAIEESPIFETAAAGTPYRVSTDVTYLPAGDGQVNPNPAPLDRSDEPRGLLGDPPVCRDGFAPDGSISTRVYFDELAYFLAIAGFDAVVTNGDGTNEVQTLTITGSPTGGSFTITYDGETTMAIPWNATPAQVQDALRGLPNIGEADVLCAGTAMPAGSITIDFEGRLAAQVIALMTTTDSLTGGAAPASNIAETTAGAPGTVLDPDGNGMEAGARRWEFTKRAGYVARTAQIRHNAAAEDTQIIGNGYACSSLQMDAAAQIQATLAGLYWSHFAADTTTVPTLPSVTRKPARRGDLTLTWLGGSGELDDFSLTLNNPLNPFNSNTSDPPTDFFDRMWFGDAQAKVSGSFSSRLLDRTDLDGLLNATQFAAVARWLSRSLIGTTGKPFGVWWDMPGAQLVGGAPGSFANTRVVPASYNWEANISEGAGYDTKVTVVCGLSEIETYV